MKPLFTLVAAIAALFATGQHYCGFDAFKEHWLSDAHHAAAFESCEQQVYQQLLQKSYRGGGEYVIPVVVHIIHQNGSENIPDEQVENAIEALNQAFANSGEFNSPEGTSVPIQFCLAQIDPEGNATSGIVRVVSPLTITTIPDQDSDLKATSFWDSHLYMNIWVIKSLIRAEGNEGIVGNATLPASHGEANDGVIVEAAFFGAPGSLGKVLVHETGHYLGLFHTFEGGCANSNCLLQGDRICDTPPDALGSTLACFDDTNSCTTDDNDTSDNNPFRPVELGGLGDQPDLQINYMDYSPPTCTVMFTEGQAERMLASLVEIRSSLLEGNRCSGPCSVETVANVVASEDTVALGSDVVFTNLSSGFTSATWYVDENIVSTDEDFVFSADATGNYFIEVVLANDEPGCAEELEFNIVVICPAVSAFDASELNIVPGETLVLDNASVGATEYSWLLDGVEFSTSTDETLV
ncbi:MAG: hypothetical protein JNM00_08560, partial [Flavobacteriales bacterium]|nr:hypothetical protein [Flavobacteriales bacterium]